MTAPDPRSLARRLAFAGIDESMASVDTDVLVKAHAGLRVTDV